MVDWGADENWQALAGQGGPGATDFARGMAFAEKALALQPRSPLVQGLIVDCLTDLGRYPKAVAAAQEMVDFKPNFASLARSLTSGRFTATSPAPSTLSGRS